MILSELSFDNLVSRLSKRHSLCGSKGYPISALINSYSAMQVERIPTLTDLSEKLKTNPILRYSCGFELFRNTPSSSTLSRFLDKISRITELESEFYTVIDKAISLGIVDGSELLIYATKIDAYEKSQPKKN